MQRKSCPRRLFNSKPDGRVSATRNRGMLPRLHAKIVALGASKKPCGLLSQRCWQIAPVFHRGGANLASKRWHLARRLGTGHSIRLIRQKATITRADRLQRIARGLNSTRRDGPYEGRRGALNTQLSFRNQGQNLREPTRLAICVTGTKRRR